MAEEDKPTSPGAGPNQDNATDQARDLNSSSPPSADSEKDAIVAEAKARVAAAREAAQKAAPAVPGAPKAPVKNGWQAEQISICMSPLRVERVLNFSPHAQVTVISLYSG